jgi:hypothetical protein
MILPPERYQALKPLLGMPMLIVYRGEPVCMVGLDPIDVPSTWEKLTLWTMTDADAVEIVMDTWTRPAVGDGIVCLCDGGCTACGGTGIYRGLGEALVVLTQQEDGLHVTALPYRRTETGIEWDEPEPRESPDGTLVRILEAATTVRSQMPARFPVNEQLQWMEGA